MKKALIVVNSYKKECHDYAEIIKQYLDSRGIGNSVFFFSAGSNSSFWCFLTLFLISRLSHAGAILNQSPLAIHLFRSAEDISEDASVYSHSFKKFRGCYLIQAI